jgi:tetratricopeptide (TPR) repeat protein
VATDEIQQMLETAYRLQQAGKLDMAEELYRKVLDLQSGNIHALNLLGMLCVNSFRPAEAAVFLQRAVKKEPGNPQTLSNLALAYKDQGKFKRAAHHFQKSISIDSGNPVVHNNLGNVYRELEQPAEAVNCFEKALNLAPDYGVCWSNMAAALQENDQLEPATRAVDRALQLDPDLAQAWNNRGDILLKQANYSDAFIAFKKAAEIDPKYFAAMVNMAKAQRDMDQPEAALETLNAILAVAPDQPEAHFIMGVLLEQMGQRDESAISFQRTIDIAPRMATAHYHLAQIKGRKVKDQELEALKTAWDYEDLTDSDRMYLAFGLFRGLDQREEYDEAFRFLAEGNRLKSASSPFDNKKAVEYFDCLIEVAKERLAQADQIPGHEDSRPVFVMGMPRSGTSLTEQILASHSEVSGAGELSYAYDTAMLAKKMTGEVFPFSFKALNPGQFAELGAYYMSRHSEENLESRYVVDKTPLNTQYIAMLCLALPGARIIHCHRDPVQNCFSIHKLPFDKKQTYAHDLSALGVYYVQHQRLMDYFKQALPDRILDVSYEETVADIDTQARKILEFLDLNFEEEVLEFHKTKRLVKTPSASQVRQPIYTDQLQSWRKYEKHLQPLIDALDGK